MRNHAERLAKWYRSDFTVINALTAVSSESSLALAESGREVLILPRHRGLAQRRNVDLREVTAVSRCALWLQPTDRDLVDTLRGPVIGAVSLHRRSKDHLLLARAVARLHGSRLHLLHIVPPVGDPEQQSAHLRRAMSVLRILRERIDSSAVLSVETGFPGALEQEAEARGATLLVVGRGGTAGQLGDGAYRIARSTALPLMIPGALSGWQWDLRAVAQGA
ncbi:MAG TPA: universal stress protein [Bryobacteraceae bacterium]|nr:universal stress protein [Bryobacteraceae bacterium]